MKTLYESILGTTVTGKLAFAKEWMKIYFEEQKQKIFFQAEQMYDFDSNGGIKNKRDGYRDIPLEFHLDLEKPVPDYIKFSDKINELFICDIINRFNKKNLPSKLGGLEISSREIGSFGFAVSDYVGINDCKRIQKIDIDFIKDQSISNRSVFFEPGNYHNFLLKNCSLSLKDLKNINVKASYPIYLTIKKGSLSLLMMNALSKLKNSDQESIDKFINDAFSGFSKNLKSISVIGESQSAYANKTPRGSWSIEI